MNLRARKKLETSERLIAVARRAFFEKGFSHTAMEDLCGEAGVTRGALYHNFGGKEGLFEAVVRQIDAEIGERLMAVCGDKVTFEGFCRTCIAYLETALEPEVQRILFQDGPSVLGQTLRDIDQEGSIGPLRLAIEDLQKQGVFPPVDAAALAIMLNGAMIDSAQWIAAGKGDARRFKKAKVALRQLLKGLRKP